MTPMCTECVTDRTHNPNYGDGTNYDAKWLAVVEDMDANVTTVEMLCNHHVALIEDQSKSLPQYPLRVICRCNLQVVTFKLHLR